MNEVRALLVLCVLERAIEGALEWSLGSPCSHRALTANKNANDAYLHYRRREDVIRGDHGRHAQLGHREFVAKLRVEALNNAASWSKRRTAHQPR